MYRITIEEISSTESDRYTNKTEIYAQTVEDLDVLAVICAVNGMCEKAPPATPEP